MKNMNKIFAGIFACALVLGAPSCGDDFLEEDAGHLISDGLLKTPEGVEQMVGGLYADIRWWGRLRVGLWHNTLWLRRIYGSRLQLRGTVERLYSQFQCTQLVRNNRRC